MTNQQPSDSEPVTTNKSQVIDKIQTISVTSKLTLEGFKEILRTTEVSQLSILEINEILQVVSKANKLASMNLDYISEFKSKLVQELRVKTRKFLNE